MAARGAATLRLLTFSWSSTFNISRRVWTKSFSSSFMSEMIAPSGRPLFISLCILVSLCTTRPPDSCYHSQRERCASHYRQGLQRPFFYHFLRVTSGAQCGFPRPGRDSAEGVHGIRLPALERVARGIERGVESTSRMGMSKRVVFKFV